MPVTQKAFTLIELMIVVAIIGILSTIALPTYQDRVIRAQVEEALALSQPLKEAVEAHWRRTGEFPADNEAAGLPAAQFMIGNYATGVALVNGAITTTLGNRVNAHIDGKRLTIRPAVVDGSPKSPISWLCGYAEPVKGMSGVGENLTSIPNPLLPFPCRPWS